MLNWLRQSDNERGMKAIEKIKLGISTCLLGENVRYDGGHKLDRFLTDTLGKYVEYVPVCPEVECGLSVPREAMRLVGKPDAPRLMTQTTGIDRTDCLLNWAERRIKALGKENLSGYIFKSRSPSCGIRDISVCSKAGDSTGTCAGLFAREVTKAFPRLSVTDEQLMGDPQAREAFFKQIGLDRPVA